MITRRSSPNVCGEERCVTTERTALEQTSAHPIAQQLLQIPPTHRKTKISPLKANITPPLGRCVPSIHKVRYKFRAMPAYVPGVDSPGWPLISALRFDQKLDYFSAKWDWKPEFLEVERSVSVCLDRPVKENHPWKKTPKARFSKGPVTFRFRR